MFKRVLTIFSFITTLGFATEKEFETIYSNTLKFEGKTYVKNQIEESKFGITKHYTKNVNALTEDKAFKIAYTRIYKAHRLNEITDKKVRAFIFDWVYNSAPRNAIKRIQLLLDIEQTGNMDTQTINALNEFTDIDLLIFLLKENRLSYLKTLKHYKKYEKGWNNRVANVV